MTNGEHPTTYAAFWPYYLREHARPRTRLIHVVGTSLAVILTLLALATENAWFFIVGLLAGYGPAWAAHFFVEKNQPATFRFPLWSLVSDFRMSFLWLTGDLGKELEKAGIAGNPGRRG